MTDIENIKYIPLTQGKTAIIDADDFTEIGKYKWRLHHKGYAVRQQYISGNKKIGRVVQHISMHRVIAGAKNGDSVDHINGDKLDNRKSNLRICDQKCNARNRKRHKNGTSIYKGVTFAQRKKPTSKMWRTVIQRPDGKGNLFLGVYHTEEDAALAYNKKALELFGEFARLNIIERKPDS